MSMDFALELHGVSKRYPGFALEDVTLCVPRGAIMGLIGENGAGKTTTLKLLLGLIKPNGGTVTLLDETETEAMQRVKERVGVVLDDGFFMEAFYPRQIDRVCRGIYANWRADAFANWLKRLSLPTDKRVRELSKGMKMKLAIAVALSHNPELLILDEATGGLDPVVRSEVLDVFLDFIQDERRAILFSTHITTDLERIADEITFLHKGKVVLQRSKDEILAAYGVLKCGAEELAAIHQDDLVGYRKGAFGCEALLKDRNAYKRRHSEAVVDPATLDDVMLYTIKGVRS